MDRVSPLVDPDVREMYAALSTRYRARYGEGGDFEFPPSAGSEICPIERIFLGSATSSLSIIMAGSVEHRLVVGVAGRTAFVLYLDGAAVRNFSLPAHEVSALSVLGRDRVLLGTLDGLLLLLDLNGEVVYIYSGLPRDCGGVVAMEVVGSSKLTLAVSTGNKSVSFVTILGAATPTPSVTHQLLIAPMEHRVLALRCKGTLLALLTENTLIIVCVENLAKPKILHKISELDAAEDCQWVDGFGLWIRLANRVVVVETCKVGDNFVFAQKKIWTQNIFGNEKSENYFLLPGGTGLEYSEGEFRLCAIRTEGGRLEYESDAAGLHVPSVQTVVHVGNVLVTATVSGGNGVDFHAVSLSSWDEILRSQLHAQNWTACMHLVSAQKKWPLQPELVAETLAKAWVSCAAADVCVCAAQGGVVSVLEDSVHSNELEEKVLAAVVELVVGNKVPATSFTSSLLNRAIRWLSAQRETVVLDTFLVTVLLADVSVDIDLVMRVASGQDLVIPLVVLHAHVLKDFHFPVDYLLARGDMVELGWFLCCATYGLLYPVGTRVDAVGEIDCAKILPKWKGDWKLLLNSVPFDFAFLGKLDSAVDRDLRLVYGAKAALVSDHPMEGEDSLDVLSAVLKTGNSHLIMRFIDRVDLVPRDATRVKQVLADLAERIDDKELVGDLVSKKMIKIIPLSELVQFFLRNDPVVTMWILQRRRCFDRLLELIEKLVAGEDLKQEVASAIARITAKSGEWFDPTQLAKIWADLIAKFPDLVATKAVLSKLDLSLVIERKHAQPEPVRRCLMYLLERNQLSKTSEQMSAIDVGLLFGDFVRNNETKEANGITATATICHVCLETLVAGKKHRQLCVFTCGHLAHHKCCDFFQEPHKLPKCPVCV